jgi:hypothetical protein
MPLEAKVTAQKPDYHFSELVFMVLHGWTHNTAAMMPH